MSVSVVPINIRPHLIPFFYEEFEGIEAKYLSRKVKACKITMQSTLGILIRVSVEKIYLPEQTSDISLYITINDQEGKNKYTSKIYKYISGEYSFLRVSPKAEKQINDVLEDYFRIGLLFYMKGVKKFSNTAVDEALYSFIIDYDLDTYGYNIEMIRRYYNRSLKKNNKLSRIQIKSSNKTLNYKVA